jgi:hypothetical protein
MTYDSRLIATIDDRVLAHLQTVVITKLRRGESFAFTWNDPERNGFGRTTIWMTPTVSLAFDYFGSKTPAINPLWVDALMRSANSPGGLHIVPEPGPPS